MDKTNKNQKTRKGGAQKERDRKKKKLFESAASCKNLLHLFKSPDKDGESAAGPAGPSKSKDDELSEESNCQPEQLQEIGENEEVQSNQGSEACSPTAEVNQASVNYFKKPCGEADRLLFWNYHPNQQTNNQVVKRCFTRKDGTNRWWLSYNNGTHALHCSVCLAFSDSSDRSKFIEGMTNWRHVHTFVEDHERTKLHLRCSTAYFVDRQQSSISHLVNRSHHNEVRRKRQVMERVVDVVKLIGKRGLSYRASEEAAYSLDEEEIDHGTFLEIVKLLGKYDSCIGDHLSNVIKDSKKHHEKKTSRGRGSLVTLLSKNTVNNVIMVIKDKIRHWISEEITDMFAIEIDTTQDITTQDQCSIVLRYVDVSGTVQERLVSLVKCEHSTGEAFVKVVSEVMSGLNIDLKNCVGNSTDGAANMQGCYKGFSTLLLKEAPLQMHIWCHAHVLNLIVTEATSVVVISTTLFSLLNDIAVFFRESYQRMNIWSKHTTTTKRIGTIGETRWWSKDAALTKVFGVFGNPDGALFIELITALNAILVSDQIQTTIKAKVKGYIDSLLKFETILTAQVYLRIFSRTTTLSKYLQTVQLDLLTVRRMVDELLENMQMLRNDFQSCHDAAQKFAKWANHQLEETDVDVYVEEILPLKRQRKRKTYDGELCSDEAISASEPINKYRIEVFNIVIDTILSSIQERFSKSAKSTLYADLSLLHPRHYGEPIPSEAMLELQKYLCRFDKSITAEKLREELDSLGEHWPMLKHSVSDAYTIQEEEDSDSEPDLHQTTPQITCKSCKDCPLCCYKVLLNLNLFTDAYKSLKLAYKLLLTLPISQVACERSFSALKRIKTRLRSTMTQEHLEAFMLMSVEKQILAKLNTQEIIDSVANKSTELQRLLIS